MMMNQGLMSLMMIMMTDDDDNDDDDVHVALEG